MRTAILMAFAAVAGAEPVTGPAVEPGSLVDPESREAPPQPLRELKSRDRRFTARVSAEAVIRRSRFVHNIDFHIGAETPIACEFNTDRNDMAWYLQSFYYVSIANLDRGRRVGHAVTLQGIDAGVIGDVPFLAMQTRHLVGNPESARVATLKLRVFSKDGYIVTCAHSDAGYVATFDRITRELADSFEAVAAEAPYFVEIKAVTLSGVNLGVAVTELRRNEDGGTQARMVTSLMLPMQDELHSQSTVQTLTLSPDQSLVTAGHFILNDGHLVLNLALRQRRGLWVVDGEREGRRLKATLPAGSAPGNWVAQALALRKLVAGDQPEGLELTLPMWIAARPTELVDMRTRLLTRRNGAEYSAQLVLPQYASDFVLDTATGLASSADVPRGEQMLHLERVHLSGSF